MLKHKLLLDSGDCKICEIGGKAYMWKDKILIAHYDGDKLYLTSSDIWDAPIGRYQMLIETMQIPDNTPEEKVEQKILDDFEENIDDDTRQAVDKLRL